jgi:hypothetical protein
MAEILRLFDGPNAYTDWNDTDTGYSLNDIEKIKDPASGTMKEVTSIPSPFARFHLFEHAFKSVTSSATNNPEKLEGNSMFHKLISDALDVGETLFNFYTYDTNPNYNLEAIRWNKQKKLELLLNSSNKSHKLLGETLKLYLAQDQEGSNFDRMENIHLIRCNYQIIGGTSPSTLFFASYNDDFRLASLGLKQGSDVFFDKDFKALHQRAPEFQKYLYSLFITNNDLQKRMKIFYDYLGVSLRRLQQSNAILHDEIRRMEGTYSLSSFVADYEEMTGENSNDPIDIFPEIYHRRKKNAPVDGGKSDFAIKADFTKTKINGLSPLVLQQGFAKPLWYLNGPWSKDIEVPFAPVDSPKERFLPGQNEKYPYLTISDFLEPHLIKLEFRLNKDSFFDGNPEGFSAGDKLNSIPPDPSYLLPIKPLYFQFFSTKTLQGRTPDGRPYFRMRKISADSVAVELRIPIQKSNEVVTFERIYQTTGNADETNNKGKIVEYQLNLGLFPAATGNGPFLQHVGLIDNDILFDTQDNRYKLTFFKEGESQPLTPDYETQKSVKQQHQRNASSHYYVMKQPYEAILVDSGHARGMVLPKPKQLAGGGKSFTFAIDFGTSNTHIEYYIEGEKPLPFEITLDDLQLTTLMETDAWYVGGVTKDLFVHEFIPELIGKDSPYSFPIRTATAEIENLDHNTKQGVLTDINICFIYEKLLVLKNSYLQLNLKWQNYSKDGGTSAKNRLRAFLGELLLLIRNKVLLNGGNLSSTRIVWFYPSSMATFQLSSFEIIWLELFEQYFPNAVEPISYSEAEAPFYAYADNRIVNHEFPVASIDIGGGTSDIVIFERNQPRLSSSVTFAGNVVWGEGYSKLPHQDNGFVTVFTPVAQRFLDANQNNGLYNLYKTFEQIIKGNDKGSEDIMSFFFSIDKNKEVRARNLKFDFSAQIGQNPDFKIIFVVFFSSIVYYTARLMKALDLKMPRYICLSGNGSRIISLLDLDFKLRQATKLSQAIFETVYQEKYHEAGLEIIQHKEPKEATCKGGIIRLLMTSPKTNYDTLCWLGDKPKDEHSKRSIIGNGDTVPTVEKLKYNELTSELKNAVIAEYHDYLDHLKKWNESLNFSNLFGVRNDKMNKYIEILKKDAFGYLELGLTKRLDMAGKEDNIGETLFFYPFIGALYRLTQEIAQGTP